VTNDIKLADITNKLRDHGRGQKDKYEHRIEGYNERLDALQAAVLKVKLNYLPEWIKNRKAVAALYDKLLKGKVMTPYADKRADHAYHLYVVGVGKNRDQLLANLQAKGIGAGIHYPLPLHQQEAYAYMNLKDGSFPTTEGASKNILSLPINPHLTNEEINYISQVLSDSI
jgi:dTDP-4-amino-4,6-dideoxygalactose transaminase